MNNGPRFSRRQVTKRKFIIPTIDVGPRQNIQENQNEEKASTPVKQSRFDPPEETPPPGEVSVTFLASTPKPGKLQLSRKRPISPIRENSDLNIRSSKSNSQKSLSETAKSQYVSSAVDSNNNSGSVKAKQSKTVFSKNLSDRNHYPSPGSSIDEKMARLTKARVEKCHQSKEKKLSERKEQDVSENAAVNDTTKSSLPENVSARLVNRNQSQMRQKASVAVNNVEVNNTSSKKGQQITSEDTEVVANVTRSFSRTSQRNSSNTLRPSNSQSKSLVQSKEEKSSKTVLERGMSDQTLNNRSLTNKRTIQKKVPESTNHMQEKSQNKEKILNKNREENRNTRKRRTDESIDEESSENEEDKMPGKSVNRASDTKKSSNRRNKSRNMTENSDEESSKSEKTDADNAEEEAEIMVMPDKRGGLSGARRKTAVNQTLQELSKSTDVTGSPTKDQTLLVWEKEGQKRNKKDITDLEVVLNAVTDTLQSHVDVYGTDEEQSAVTVLQKYLTRDITQMITCTQSALSLQTDIKRKEQRVKQKQKELMSLQKERIELEEKCEPWKRQQSSNEKMVAINQFLTDLSALVDKC